MQLCDFGLSRIRYETPRAKTTIREGGCLRFLAPELTIGDDDEDFRSNEASDIYSFAMTILSLGTQAPPFQEILNDRAAARAARKGHRPLIPLNLGNLDENLYAKLMKLIVAMWHHNPVMRPSAAQFSRDIECVILY